MASDFNPGYVAQVEQTIRLLAGQLPVKQYMLDAEDDWTRNLRPRDTETADIRFFGEALGGTMIMAQFCPGRLEGKELQYVGSGTAATVHRTGPLAVKTFLGVKSEGKVDTWLQQVQKVYASAMWADQPCVPPVDGVCWDCRCPCVILDYIDGTELSNSRVCLQPLASFVEKGGEKWGPGVWDRLLKPAEAAHVTTLLSWGISCMHDTKDCTFVDLKPSNIKVRRG